MGSLQILLVGTGRFMFLFVSIYLCERKLMGVEKWFGFPSPSFIVCAVSETQLYPSALPSFNTGITQPNTF